MTQLLCAFRRLSLNRWLNVSKIPHDEVDYHLDHCIKSGLSISTAKDA